MGLALLSTAPSAARQAAAPSSVTAPTAVTSIRAADFFTPTRVWTAHLSMTAEAWKAMQPQYGQGAGGFGGFGGGRSGGGGASGGW